MKKKYLLVFIIFVSMFFCLNIGVKAETCSYTINVNNKEIFDNDSSPYTQYRKYIYASDDVYYDNNYKMESWKKLKEINYSSNSTWKFLIDNTKDKLSKKSVNSIEVSFNIGNGSFVNSSLSISINNGKKIKISNKSNVINIANSCPDAIAFNVPADSKELVVARGFYLNEAYNNLDMLFVNADKSFINFNYNDLKKASIKMIMLNNNFNDFYGEKSCLLKAYYNFDNIEDLRFSKSDAGEIVDKYLNIGNIRKILDEMINLGENFKLDKYFNSNTSDIVNFWYQIYKTQGNANISEEIDILRNTINGVVSDSYDQSWSIYKCEKDIFDVNYSEKNDEIKYYDKQRKEWIKKYTKYNSGAEQYLPYMLDLLKQYEFSLTDRVDGVLLLDYMDIYASIEEALEACNSASDDYYKGNCDRADAKQKAKEICINAKYGNFDVENNSNISKENILSQFDNDGDGEISYYESKDCINGLESKIIKENEDKTNSDISTGLEESKAESTEKIYNVVKNYTVIKQTGINIGEENDNLCSLLDKNGNLYSYMMMAINWIRIGGPILVIFLTGYDAIQTFASSKEDENKKFWKHLKVRLICVALLILVPTIINFMVDLFRIVTCKYI